MSIAPTDIAQCADKLEFLVLDANAFIRGHGLNLFHKAHRLCTTQEVLNEVRDAKAQDLLARLPFTLEVLTPSPEACKEVASFAMKTGDFRQLSKTDLRLIALTYMLHEQVHGEPPRRRKTLADLAKAQDAQKEREKARKSESSAVKEQEEQRKLSVASEADTEAVQGEQEKNELAVEEEEESESESDGEEVDIPADVERETERASEKERESETAPQEVAPQTETEREAERETSALADSLSATLSVSAAPKKAFSWADVAKNTKPVQRVQRVAQPRTLPAAAPVETAPHSMEAATEEDKGFVAADKKPHAPRRSNALSQTVHKENESRAMALEDDHTGWINTENLHTTNTFEVFAKDGPKEKETIKQDKKKAKKPSEPKSSKYRVACFTTDFSMQNVLLQLGLKVLASDGMFVRSARQWVLRCVGCRTVHTKDLNRLFCSQCGLSQLSRIAASVDAHSGKLRLHLKANYRVDTRGTKYSLPAPGKQNRFDGELLLREDQLLTGIWRQKTVKYNRNIQSAFGESVTEEVGLHMNKLERDVVVGWGAGNPNARRGRERRGKKHSKH